ncbi:MAG TPA: MFS transporter [Pirellulales bacterium]|jgi:MFS family permease|nr:MFS transporter [Pirellulales bacterium]
MINRNDRRLFWACWIALVATAFGFMIRGSLLDTWGAQFGLDEVQKGQINGAGIWPFAVSIILFSLFIDKIGYGRAMVFAFLAHVSYVIVVVCAPLVLAAPGAKPEATTAGQQTGYWMLYIGNLIFALGNGTVEAVVNPVVATMFSRDKTKWLNALHAGWPGGLVLAGLIAIGMGSIAWQWKVGMIFLPVVVYGLMMLSCKFPVNERVAAGSSYRDMLAEFGILGALVAFPLIIREVGGDFGASNTLQIVIAAVIVLAFGAAARSFGRPMFIFILLIMFPLATTELGTDNWITSLMTPEMEHLGYNAAWVLVYTSIIMLILRLAAGPIVHKLSPLGLLAVCAVLAACGLFFLSKAAGMTIFAAATLYGVGKSFFWPTMLGVVSEQFPKGGALTLNATGGVGMLAVGVLGMPFIGLLQEKATTSELRQQQPALYAVVKADADKQSVFGTYESVDPTKVSALPKADQDEIAATEKTAKKGALASMAVFPCIMFVCYLILIIYFRSKGGYQAQVLTGHAARDKEFTGGTAGPGEA